MLTRVLRSFALALLVVCLAGSSAVGSAARAPQNQPPSLRHAFIVTGEPSAPRAAPAAAQVGAGVRMVVNTFAPDVVADGHCSLIEALLNANADAAVSPDCPAGSGPDTLALRPGTYTLTQAYEDMDGGNGLPAVTSNITIRGHGATVTRSADPSTPAFRILEVITGGTLTLRDLTISNGRAATGWGGGGDPQRGRDAQLFKSQMAGNFAEEWNAIPGEFGYGAAIMHGTARFSWSIPLCATTSSSNGYTAGIFAIDSVTVVRHSEIVHNTASSDYAYLGGAVGLCNVAISSASTMRIEEQRHQRQRGYRG